MSMMVHSLIADDWEWLTLHFVTVLHDVSSFKPGLLAPCNCLCIHESCGVRALWCMRYLALRRAHIRTTPNPMTRRCSMHSAEIDSGRSEAFFSKLGFVQHALAEASSDRTKINEELQSSLEELSVSRAFTAQLEDEVT